MSEEHVLTIKEIAEILKLAEKTACSIAEAGEVPTFEVRAKWWIRKVDFEAWMAEQAAAPRRDRDGNGGRALMEKAKRTTRKPKAETSGSGSAANLDFEREFRQAADKIPTRRNGIVQPSETTAIVRRARLHRTAAKRATT